MPTIEFWVDGTPKGQPRARAAFHHGRVRVYDSGTAEGWKSQIAVAAREFIPATPMLGPVRLCITYYFAHAASHFKKDGSLRPAHQGTWHLNKPDLDNCDKAVMDCLTNLKFWKDDSQVCAKYILKYWSKRQGAMISLSEPDEPIAT